MQAELHGMGPLLWHHLHKKSQFVPIETQRSLRGLYLRNRLLNQAQFKTLAEIQAAFEKTGIQAVILKGLGLAFRYYPDPALRSTGDIDLLLNKNDVVHALQMLTEMGYRVYASKELNILPKELSAISPAQNGLSDHIEVHHYNPEHRKIKDNSPDEEFKGFKEPPQELQIGQNTCHTLSGMDTLHYISQHTFRHLWDATTERPLPLKWFADLLNIVESQADSLDWKYLQLAEPKLLKRLSIIYSLTPLPSKYQELIPIVEKEPPKGCNQYPRGWPQQPFHHWHQIGFWRYIWRTFTPPSEWWLCLYYGINQDSTFWYGQVVYRLEILRLMLWAVRRRIASTR